MYGLRNFYCRFSRWIYERQLLFLKEEKEWEVGFLSEQVTDIGDINDSNLRVKEGLIDQVINYDNSLGTVYDATEQLEQEQSVEIFFCALNMIQKLMDCPDVAICRVNKEKYASSLLIVLQNSFYGKYRLFAG